MDADRFDTISRALIAAGSRRGALAAVLGGTLGLLGLASPDTAPAAKSGTCKPKCAECETCQKRNCERRNGKKACKRGKCTPKANGTPCRNGRQCQNGRCRCPSGTTECSGACVNTSTDSRNCGDCGRRCSLNQVCSAGTCTCPNAPDSCSTFRPGTTCCGNINGNFGCNCTFSEDPFSFTDPATCSAVSTCPPNTLECIGGPGTCRACCPAGTTCDTTNGSCLP